MPSPSSRTCNSAVESSFLKLKTLASVDQPDTLPWLGFDRVQPTKSVLQGKYRRIN
jgi:hypothetical protein